MMKIEGKATVFRFQEKTLYYCQLFSR